MCEFISWVEKGDKVLFLTAKKLETKKGRMVLERCGDNDIIGHGAIRLFYGLEQDEGTNRECTDFSKPENFPSLIVKAIKDGKMAGLGIAVQLITQPARAEYENIEEQAWAEYKKIAQPARAEYERITQQARAEYKKIQQQARAEYENIEEPALAEYKKIEQQAWAEYERIQQQARAEYEKIQQQAWAEYKKIEQQAFWSLFAIPENRIEVWK